MAWPWGGSMTHAQLAEKFTWPSVVVSLLLLPFLFIWRHVFAFPFFVGWWFPHGNINAVNTYYTYPSKEDFVRKEIYCGLTNNVSYPSGFCCHADVEGNKWFETFWGIMQVLDLDTTPDRMILSPNMLSIVPANVEIHFPKPPVHQNHLQFNFPILGLNLLNPFMYVTLLPASAGFFFWTNLPGKSYLAMNDVTVKNVLFPPAEEVKKD
jgi:hypothetical protein